MNCPNCHQNISYIKETNQDICYHCGHTQPHIKAIKKTIKESERESIEALLWGGGISFSIFLLAIFFSIINPQSNIKSESSRTDKIFKSLGVGDTIDSWEEAKKVCMAAAKEENIPYSYAIDFCNNPQNYVDAMKN